MEPLTTQGRTDHGAPDPLPSVADIDLVYSEPLSQEAIADLERIQLQPLDPPGLCPRCHRECRDFTNVGGREFCDSCAEMVMDIRLLFADCKALEGTGQP